MQLDGPEGIAVSPDGESVYVGSYFGSAVTVFDRVSYNGTLTQRAGANGCIVNVATSGCTTGLGLGGANGLAISPEGDSVYVGSYDSNALDVFKRTQVLSGRVAVNVPSSLIVSSKGTVSVPVNCRGTTHRRCPGGLSLQASSQKLQSAALRTIGRGSFNVRVGTSGSVKVALSSSALRYLNSNDLLPVTAVMRVVQPTGRIKTFREQINLAASTRGAGGGSNGSGGDSNGNANKGGGGVVCRC